MRNLIVTIYFMAIATSAFSQVGINTNNNAPDPSAMLDVQSTDKGMLIPRLDSIARKAIIDPAEALMVYDTDSQSFWYHDGEEWTEIGKARNDVLAGLPAIDSILCDTSVIFSNILEPIDWDFYDGISIASQSFINQSEEDSLFSVEIIFAIGGPIGFGIDPDGIQDGVLRIYEGDTNGLLLHSQSIVIPETDVWHNILLSSKVPLIQGQQYTIELEEFNDTFTWARDSDDTNNYSYQVFGTSCAIPYFVEPSDSIGVVTLSNIDTINFANGRVFDGLVNRVEDTDGDTKIEVESSTDKDEIDFYTAGAGKVFSIRDRTVHYPSANRDIFIGHNSGASLSQGRESASIGIGTNTLSSFNDISTRNNVAIGHRALEDFTGHPKGRSNVAVGYLAFSQLLSGDYNIAIGDRAGTIDNGGFDNDSNILSRIDKSIILGAFTSPSSPDVEYSNVVAIGHNADWDCSDCVVLGKNANVGIGSNNPQAKLHVVGDLLIQDGTEQSGYVLTSDADGRSSWQAPAVDDDQTIDVLNLDGTNLEISLQDDGQATQTLDLASIDTDTDDQTIDILNLDGTTLEISLQDDGQATQTLDLASINTDDQTIDVLNLDGTTLELSLQDDGQATQTLDLASIDTDTDDQTIDVLNLDGTNLEISLQDDGQATQTLDLASINTDDQTIDVLNLEGTNLEISLQDDGQATQTLDLASIDTDDQTLSFDGVNLSIADGNSVDISSLGNTQNIIEDLDGNTKIQVEESTDEDIIRFDLANTEILRLSKNANGVTLFDLSDNALGCTIFGSGAGASVGGSGNTFFGSKAGSKLNGGTYNTFIGGAAGRDMTQGNDNVLLGNSAGRSIVTASRNVIVGANAGLTSSGSDNVLIGNWAGSSETNDARLYIESLTNDPTNPLIYGEFDNDIVRINGDLEVTGSFPGSDDQTLSFDGSSLSISEGNSVDISSIDTDNQTLSYDDDTQSVAISGGNTLDLTQLAVPVGSIMMWSTATPPDGWLICDGTTFNASTYPALNTVLGGNALPDLIGRFALGAGERNEGSNHPLLSTGGQEDVKLDEDNIPAHNHKVTIGYREGAENGQGQDYSDLGASSDDHNGSRTYDTDSWGGSDNGLTLPHENMPPFLTLHYIIKAK